MNNDKIFSEHIRILVVVILLLLLAINDDFQAEASVGESGVVAWEKNWPGQTIVPSGLKTNVAISAGPDHDLALMSDDTLVGWGDNGGGWINSPAGAYKADESLSGKATFGVVARNQKGASGPAGNTVFKFDLAGLTFTSQSYDWLVVNQAGTHAQFKGSGLVNGTSDANGNAYKFRLWAEDGSSTHRADTFRIRIWWEDDAGVHVVYDNGVAQPTGPGNIVVHKSK